MRAQLRELIIYEQSPRRSTNSSRGSKASFQERRSHHQSAPQLPPVHKVKHLLRWELGLHQQVSPICQSKEQTSNDIKATHGEPVSAEPSKPKVDTGLFTGVPRAAPSPLIKAPEEGGMTATSGPLEAFNPPQAKDKGTAEGKGKDKATTEPEPETPKSIKRKSGFDQLYDPDASQLDIPTQSEKWI